MLGECYSKDVLGSKWAIMCTRVFRERSPHAVYFIPLIRSVHGTRGDFALDQFNTLCRLTTIHDRADLLERQPNLPIVWSRVSAAKELHIGLQYISSGFSVTNEFHVGFFHFFILAKLWRKMAREFESLGKQQVFDDVLSSNCSGINVGADCDIENVFENMESYISNFGLKTVPVSLFATD